MKAMRIWLVILLIVIAILTDRTPLPLLAPVGCREIRVVEPAIPDTTKKGDKS